MPSDNVVHINMQFFLIFIEYVNFLLIIIQNCQKLYNYILNENSIVLYHRYHLVSIIKMIRKDRMRQIVRLYLLSCFPSQTIQREVGSNCLVCDNTKLQLQDSCLILPNGFYGHSQYKWLVSLLIQGFLLIAFIR